MSDFDRELTPDDALDLELDRAIDALNREQRPHMSPADGREYREALEAAMLLRSTEPPASPEDGFAVSLAARLAQEPLRPSPNGRVSATRVDPLTASAAPRWGSAMIPAARAAGACALGGMIAGMVVGGVGGRVAMLVSGAMYRRENPHTRIITESSGRWVGEFTWSGTFDLIAQMMVYGLIGGLFYFIARRWLPRSPWTGGLLFGVLLLLVGGATIISADNRDFDRIGSPVVNVLMFGSLLVLFGLAVGPLERWASNLVPRNGQRANVARSMVGWAVVVLGGLALMIATMLFIAGILQLGLALARLLSGDLSVSYGVAVVTIASVLVVLPVSRALVAALDRGLIATPVRVQAVDAIGRWALWIALTAGAVLTLIEVARITGVA